MKREPGGRGFTLLEVLCALALTGVVLATILATFRGVVRGFVWARESVRESRVAAGVARTVRRDVAGMYALVDDELAAFIGRGAAAGESVARAAFFTTHSFAGPGPASLSPLRRVEYLVRPSDRTTGRYALDRRETVYSLAERSMAERGRAENLADGLVSVGFSFSTGKAWRTDWRGKGLPAAVSVRLVAQREGDPRERAYGFVAAPAVSPDADAAPMAGKGTKEQSEDGASE